MHISQVYSFTIATSDDNVREFKRNPFSNNEHEAFSYELRSRVGGTLEKFFILESTAELSLEAALALKDSRPDLIQIEIQPLMTGTEFNHPKVID